LYHPWRELERRQINGAGAIRQGSEGCIFIATPRGMAATFRSGALRARESHGLSVCAASGFAGDRFIFGEETHSP